MVPTSDRRSVREAVPPLLVVVAGVVILVAVAFMGRYGAVECHTQFRGSWVGRTNPTADGGQGPAVSGGCYVLDRWTGRVTFQVAFDDSPAVAAPEEQTPLERLRQFVGEQ